MWRSRCLHEPSLTPPCTQHTHTQILLPLFLAVGWLALWLGACSGVERVVGVDIMRKRRLSALAAANSSETAHCKLNGRGGGAV